jgi:hypothetical protein
MKLVPGRSSYSDVSSRSLLLRVRYWYSCNRYVNEPAKEILETLIAAMVCIETYFTQINKVFRGSSLSVPKPYKFWRDSLTFLLFAVSMSHVHVGNVKPV